MSDLVGNPKDRFFHDAADVCFQLWNTCHRPDLVRASLKKTLDDLGLKYLDLFLIHWPVAYKVGLNLNFCVNSITSCSMYN